ncbi:MAG: SCP2 sterol-binding domain-containing protein, partial [Defluviitaleaceae bacterium]|nr:SCP2 sterol-binding domain-containing protein [Defluviitaleaceae bacterium]
PPINLAPATPPAPVEPRLKTARQITQNLPHYFQPQLSSGLQAVIQISITGEEAFEGFLYIHSTECSYSEGAAPAPDIIIMADTAVWMDVLKNKHTAQKAFMIGGLKVRGDFVLLTKFDTLFKLEN